MTDIEEFSCCLGGPCMWSPSLEKDCALHSIPPKISTSRKGFRGCREKGVKTKYTWRKRGASRTIPRPAAEKSSVRCLSHTEGCECLGVPHNGVAAPCS